MDFNLFIDLAKIAHSAFNSLLALAFAYQARVGLSIRRGRKSGQPRPAVVGRHRKLGILLVLMSVVGYGFGLTLVIIDKGHVLEYPLHFTVGSLIVLAVLGQFAVSKKIKGRDSSFRTPHLILGVGILCLYALQILLGVGVLL